MTRNESQILKFRGFVEKAYAEQLAGKSTRLNFSPNQDELAAGCELEFFVVPSGEEAPPIIARGSGTRWAVATGERQLDQGFGRLAIVSTKRRAETIRRNAPRYEDETKLQNGTLERLLIVPAPGGHEDFITTRLLTENHEIDAALNFVRDPVHHIGNLAILHEFTDEEDEDIEGTFAEIKRLEKQHVPISTEQ